MQKTRKTSHITNIIQFDADGHVVIPASLTLGIAPGADDNSAKVPSTAWVRSIVTTAGGAYVPTSRTITINGVSYDLSANRSWSINTGVLTATAGAGISVSTVDANLNIVNTGLLTATAGAGISVSTVSQNLNIVNTGLLTATAGAGISVSTVNQNLNIVSTAILTATAGSGISVSVVDQNLNVVNTGLLTATAGSGISISTVNQNLNIVNTGLRTATAGAGISISVVDGNLNIVNTITNNNQLTNGADYATTSFVTTQINNLVAGAPGLLDTLDELAQALGDDPNFATTVTTALSNRLRIDTASQGLNSTQQANGRTNLGLGSLAVLSSVANAQITDVAWSKVTGAPAFITGNQTITLSGDATGSGATAITVTLANSGVVAGTYGSSTAVPVLTVDAKGRVTGVTTASISGSLTFTGDVTGSGTTGSSTTLTLANSGVTAGTYRSVTVDAKGRVTAGTNPTTLSGYGITDALSTSGGTLTGRLIVPAGASGGIAFPADSFGGSGDTATITLQNPAGGEATRMTFTMTNDADDTIGFVVPSGNGVLVNGNIVWHQGNLTNLNQLTNGPGYITGYTETDTLATVTARGATTSTALTLSGNVAIGGLQTRSNINFENQNGFHRIAFWDLRFWDWDTGTDIFTLGQGDGNVRVTNSLLIAGNTAWHQGNLTNLNQLTNGPGYITSSGSITGDAGSVGGVSAARLVFGGSGSRRGVNQISNWNQGDFPDVAFLSSESGIVNAPTSDFTYGLQYAFHRSGAAYRTQMVTSLYSDSTIWVRNSRDNDVWTSWKVLLHSGNYNSYAPTLTGGGASGTWSINVTGTAGSETLATVTGRGASTNTYITQTGTADWYMYGFGARGASAGQYGIGLTADIANRTLSFHVPDIAAYSNSGNTPRFGWYSNNATELMTLQSAAGHLWLRGDLGIGRTVASNESIAVDNPEGTWLIQGYRGTTGVGGLHTNSGILHLQANSGAEIRLETSGNVTWSGNIIATRSWVQSQGYVTGGPYLALSGGTMTGNVQFNANTLQFNNSGVRSWNMAVSGGNLNISSGDGSGSLLYNSRPLRDSFYRTFSGYSDYYSSGSSGWYRAAEITLTGNCSGAVLYGTLYDHRYDGADTYQIAIVARAECDFTSNNESHYINVGCTILGSTNYTNYRDKIRVVLSASSGGSRTYELQIFETPWNHDTWQLETTGWTIYTSPQAPRSGVGTPRVNYISNNNADNIRANNGVFSPHFYDSSNSAFYLDGNVSGGWRLGTPSGFLDFGPLNSGFCHFQTDRDRFYFNKRVEIDGELWRHNGSRFVEANGGTWGINISGIASNSSALNGLSVTQIFNNMGQGHTTRTSFDASTPSYDFGFRFIQGSANGPGTGGTQYYSWYIGLGNDYAATGGGSYGAMFAVDRDIARPYLSVRYNENNSFGSWRRIAAGFADSSGRVVSGTSTLAGVTFANTMLATQTAGRVTNFDGNGSSPSVWWTNGSTAIGAIDAIGGGGLSFWSNNGSAWQQQISMTHGTVNVLTTLQQGGTQVVTNNGGTWGINITGNAGSVNGNMQGTWVGNITWNAGVNVLVNGESSFDLYSGGQFGVWESQTANWWIRANWGDHLRLVENGKNVIVSGSRLFNDSGQQAVFNNGGTWGINITGNAGSASSVAWGNVSSKPADWLNATNLIAWNVPNNAAPSGFYEHIDSVGGNPVGTWFNYINVRHSNPGNVHGYQIGMSYYDNNLWFRSYQGQGTYQAWALALSTQNFSQYAIPLTGGTISGTITAQFNNNWGFRVDRGSVNHYNGFVHATSGTNNWYVGSREDGTNTYRIYNFQTTVNAFSVDVNGNCTANGDVTAYSDARVKENVKTIENALDKTLRMRGVTYTRSDSDDKKVKLGVIAQEVLDVLPEVVNQDVDGMYNVAYGNLTSLLIEAIKEQQAQIEDLKNQITELKENK